MHTHGACETIASPSAHHSNGPQQMGIFTNPDRSSTLLSGVGRQPLRERHICPNVNDDIPPQRCKEGRRQLRHPHARTLYRGKAHSARCAARPTGQEPVDEHRPVVKEVGQGQPKVLRIHRKVDVESSSCRPTTQVTSAVISRATLKDTIGSPQGLGDEKIRTRTSVGTMRSAVSGDVRDNLERWRNHYSRSTIGSLSYVESPLDVITATDPTNASFVSNTDPGREKPSNFLAANGPSLSLQSRPRRRCWLCGSECSHGPQEGVSSIGSDGVLVRSQPVGLPPTARTRVLPRPAAAAAAAAAAAGCWFCREGEAVDEKPARLGADCRDARTSPISTAGGHVSASRGRARFDGRADGAKFRDSHNGSAGRRLELTAGRQTESGVAERVELHVGTQARTRSRVGDVGEERGRREAQATLGAADGLNGGSTKGRDQDAGEQRRSAGECRRNGLGLAWAGLSESLVDDRLATLRSGTHWRFQERGRHRPHGTVVRDGTRTIKKNGLLEGTVSGDGANLGGRENGCGCEREKRNSAEADGDMGKNSFPQSGPRGEFSRTREPACFGYGGRGGRSRSDAQAGGDFFGDPLCWEEEGVWWFRPRVKDATPSQPQCCSHRLA